MRYGSQKRTSPGDQVVVVVGRVRDSNDVGLGMQTCCLLLVVVVEEEPEVRVV